ncbi:tyrosine-type recombinase/integrase [Candidatus Woesearchaeota archaeon]|nr:tyrosine-type recombinase/integrase [Candidatus Woesearchaeota archaeon]
MDIDYLMKRELLRRRYSTKTIQSYSKCLDKFFQYHKDKNPRKITKTDVKDFIDIKLVDKNRSGNTINLYFNAVKFFMENILNKRLFYNIKYSKVPRRLPIVLTKEEIKKLINIIENKKHKLIVKLMYSSGLRVSELVNLRVEDFQFDKNYGFVRNGKGGKDRLFIIAQSLKDELKKFIIENNLKEFIFKGNKNCNLSVRTVQEIIKRNTKRAKIDKKVHPHTLRHSFATHLIENGYDVTSVQSLLGHNSAETTMRYLHTASPKMINVKSPLDSL